MEKKRFGVYQVIEKGGKEKDFWHKLGTAFSHKDGRGCDVCLTLSLLQFSSIMILCGLATSLFCVLKSRKTGRLQTMKSNSDHPTTMDIVQTARAALYSIGDCQPVNPRHFHHKHRLQGVSAHDRCIVCAAITWLEWWIVRESLEASGVVQLAPPSLPNYFVDSGVTFTEDKS